MLCFGPILRGRPVGVWVAERFWFSGDGGGKKRGMEPGR